MKLKLSPRSALVLIAAMFIVPLLAAWLMYSGTIDYQPVKTRNHGNLVQPAIPLGWDDISFLDSSSADSSAPAEAFEGHWVILHPIDPGCSDSCLQAVDDLRQVHKASGRHQARIRLALLVNESMPEALLQDLEQRYSVFEFVTADSPMVMQHLNSAGPGHINYLIDPLGNIMMTYDHGSDPNDLKKDLKRLLTWSKLDEQS